MEGHEGRGVSPPGARQPPTWQAAGDSWPSLVNTRNTLQIIVKSTQTPPQVSTLPVRVVLPQVGTTTLLNVQKKKKLHCKPKGNYLVLDELMENGTEL